MKDKIADVLGVETSVDTALVVSKYLTIDNNTVSIVIEMLHSNTLLIKGLSDYHIYQILSMLVNNASIEEPLLKQVDNNVDLIIPKEVVAMSDLQLEIQSEEIAETDEEIIETEEYEDDDEIEVSEAVLELFCQIEEMDLSLSEILSLIERLTVLAQAKYQEEQEEAEDEDEDEIEEEYDDEDQE
jgi:hypothetical protein